METMPGAVHAVLATSAGTAACPLSSAEWLAQAPRGAYTTARTVGGDAVFELSFHIDRLASSARLMMAAGEAAGACEAAQQHSDLTDAATLRPSVLRLLRSAIDAHRSFYTEPHTELKLTVLVTWRPDSSEIRAHAQPLGARPAPPVKALALGAPRSNAAAKDSDWVRQRRAYEAQKPSDVEEVLLVGAGGAVLEGLSSNFLVLQGGVLRTAGEGVLLGSVRAAALRVAARLGVGADLRAPVLGEAAAWEAAFLSSTSRLLLPLDEVAGPEADPPVRRVFARSELVDALEAGVAAEAAACCEKVPVT